MIKQSSSSRRGCLDNDEVQFTVLNNGRIRVATSKEFLPEFLIKVREAIESGRTDEARKLITDDNIKIVREMVEKYPSRMAVMYTLAMSLVTVGRFDEAEEWYLKISERNPHWAVYNELANIKEKKGQRTEEMEYREKAMETEPDNGVVLNNYGMHLGRMGDAQQGIKVLRKAVEKAPGNPAIHSNFLFFLHYLPEADRQSLFKEHKRWARMQGPTTLARTSHDNVPDPNRRLRIGYISPDFRKHSVAYFFEILLDECNHEAVETYGYNNVDFPDDVTKRLKFKFDHFRNIFGASDEAVIEMIEKDKIDILVDLTGHTANHRLPVLAHKPAPIQVTYLGYPDTTGMEQVDYRLTDELADPPESQQFYTEELIYLPDGFLCYKPADYAPPVAPLPSLKNGYITFGSFNNNCKINPFIMSLWAEVLKANDGSRFILKFRGSNDEGLRDFYYRKFEELGIHRDRVDIQGPKSPVEHLKLYSRIDIALDTYPYNGATTTFEALWMGVPVISLVGQHHMSRVGLTILTRFGMGFLATSTPQEYVIRATALAAKTDTLAEMRGIMRRTIAGASLCNTNRFVRNVEAAYREMWHRWCRSRDVEVPVERSRLEDQGSDAEAAEHSLDTRKQKTNVAVQDAAREPNLAQLSRIAKLAVLADNFRRTGHRKQAAEYALEGLNRLHRGEKAGDIPRQILLNWNVWEEKTLFVHLCISLIAYSSYYNPTVYTKLFLDWIELEPLNPEPHLRFGLLLALDAKRMAITSPPASLKALRHAESMMRSERSAAALALAERKLTKLSLPYDGGRIYVYPDLCNVTTYVLLEQGDWFEHDDLALFRSLIRPGDKLLDLGANVGVYAISAALRTGSQGRVVAVEPAKDTFELLNKSASAFEHITAVRAAVSDKSGTGSLLHGRAPEENKLGAGQEQGEKVDIFSVDDLAAKTGVDCFDIIKMDVEGHEQQTIAGAQKIIGENSPIIFYEIKEGNDLHTELIGVFQKLGYESYYYVGSTSTLVKFRKGQELDAYLLNMVAVHPESLHRFDGLVHIADLTSKEPRADVQRCGTGQAIHSSASIQAVPSQSVQTNQKSAMEKPSIRIFHNLGRSGGTLVSKCLGCMKGTVLLSEIHPLGTHIWDPISQARKWHNLLTPEDIRYLKARRRVDFVDTIRFIESRCAGTGRQLVIRDWAHLDFMGIPFVDEPGYRMLLVEELAPAFKTIQSGLVRHPIDQWLSLRQHRAIRENLGLEAFLRGYFLFAEEIAGIGYVRYEDFTRQPTEQIKILCEKLQLDFDKDFLSKWADYTFVSGDITKGTSRGGELREIVSLPRYPLEPDLLRQFRENADYWNILELLGYSDVQEDESSVTRSSSASAESQPGSPTTKAKTKPPKRKINAKRIFISSMPRSGSMWTYNVARSLIRAAGMEPIPKNVPVNTQPFVKKAFIETLSENQVYCVKTHYIMDHNLPDTLIIVPYRDIRDAVFSHMKFMGLSFEEAFRVPKRWMVLTDRYFENQSPDILKIRYDEIVNEPMDTIQKIDRFISTGASFETIEKINEEFSRKKMKEKVDGLKDISPEQVRVNAVAFDTVGNLDGSVRVLDRATGFQTGHVSFRKDGEWREVLTEEQKQHLMNETADWLQRHGFEL